MIHRREDRAFGQVLEVLIENGMEGIDQALEIVFNEAMKLERADFLRAGSYEMTAERRGYSNQEIKRRTRVARLFPNEESLIRLGSAVLAETARNGRQEDRIPT